MIFRRLPTRGFLVFGHSGIFFRCRFARAASDPWGSLLRAYRRGHTIARIYGQVARQAANAANSALIARLSRTLHSGRLLPQTPHTPPHNNLQMGKGTLPVEVPWERMRVENLGYGRGPTPCGDSSFSRAHLPPAPARKPSRSAAALPWRFSVSSRKHKSKNYDETFLTNKCERTNQSLKLKKTKNSQLTNQSNRHSLERKVRIRSTRSLAVPRLPRVPSGNHWLLCSRAELERVLAVLRLFSVSNLMREHSYHFSTQTFVHLTKCANYNILAIGIMGKRARAADGRPYSERKGPCERFVVLQRLHLVQPSAGMIARLL